MKGSSIDVSSTFSSRQKVFSGKNRSRTRRSSHPLNFQEELSICSLPSPNELVSRRLGTRHLGTMALFENLAVDSAGCQTALEDLGSRGASLRVHWLYASSWKVRDERYVAVGEECDLFVLSVRSRCSAPRSSMLQQSFRDLYVDASTCLDLLEAWMLARNEPTEPSNVFCGNGSKASCLGHGMEAQNLVALMASSESITKLHFKLL